jgi:segregation and condensation protein A
VEYKVKIDAFEGPLDLLLHLIRTMEIDIYDIPVAEITDQYLDFIHHMRHLELDVAGEYLVMAATLIAMKSRMLLPKPEPEEATEDDEEDPETSRQELMRRLLEYRRYKEAAQALKSGESRRMLLYAVPPADLSRYERNDFADIPMSQRAGLDDLLRAIRRMNARRRLERPLPTKIDRQPLPIGTQMHAMVGRLRRAGHPVPFDRLYDIRDRLHRIVTFLALLELMKKNAVACLQRANFAEIIVGLKKGADWIGNGEDTFGY